MTTKKNAAAPAETEAAAPKKRGMFAKFSQIDDATSGGDLINFTLQLGANKCRVLTEPVMIRKHWDLPQSADMKGAVPCWKHIPADRMDEYGEACENGTADEFLATLEDCPYCRWAEEYPGFYTVKEHWVFNVVQDGEVKVAEFYQSSILRAINDFENDEDWIKITKGDLTAVEINIKKEQTGPKPQNVKYSVTGVPGSEPLHPAQKDEYMSKMVDIVKLKVPPSLGTDEGQAKLKEYLAKAGEPKPGEKPKGFNN